VREANPALGSRSLRWCFEHEDAFLPQLRAILRVAAEGDVRVMLPMVGSATDVRRAKALLRRAAESLARDGVSHRADPPVGAMVEIPAAAVIADLLAREVDFFSIGTNDLIQYTLAVDRGNESVAPLYEPLHPAVLRMISFVVRSARARAIPVSICGEMAANPALAPLLLGLGLRELSVPPRSVATVRAAIRGIDAARATRVAEEALGDASAEQVQKRLRPDVPAVS
jgi:phosphotransferase system enzyme I (PtsI)